MSDEQPCCDAPNYQYQGLVHWLADYNCYGSGAQPRLYADRYYCTRCLRVVDRNTRSIGDNSYRDPIAGSFPR